MTTIQVTRRGWINWLSFGLLGRSSATSAAVQATQSISPSILDTVGRGLYEIYNPLDAEVDIVFVHGLTGSRNTWKHPETQTIWPLHFLPKDIPKARLFIWEYDADVFAFLGHTSRNRLHEHGANFCDRLAGRRFTSKTQGRPLIFVCHSLGGLVSMKALLHAQESDDTLYTDMVDSTVGLIFLGTPFRGSSIAKWGKLGADFAHITNDVNRDIVRLLKPGSETLLQLRNSFLSFVRKRAQNSNKPNVQIKTIFEELGITLVGKVVDIESAMLEGFPSACIHADHVGMTKFKDNKDDGYECVLSFLLAIISQAVGESQPFWSGTMQPFVASNAVRKDEPYKLIPDGAENMHQSLGALLVWNMSQQKPSREFTEFSKQAPLTDTQLMEIIGNDTLSELPSVSSSSIRPQPAREAAVRSFLGDWQNNRIKTRANPGVDRDSNSSNGPPVISLEERGAKSVIAQWLSDIDHRIMHDFHSSQRYQASGIWLSESKEFQQWRDRATSSLFWLHGPPGIGKTVLSSFVVDALSANPSVNVHYFYCNNKQFRNSTSILRSFLRQAYLSSPRKNIVESFYETHREKKPCSGDGPDLKLFLDLFLDILNDGRTYFVLDGADQCTHDGITELLGAWRHISSRSRQVLKLFISSRDENKVREQLEKEVEKHKLVGSVSFAMETANVRDLNEYVDGMIDSVMRSWGLWQQSTDQELSNAVGTSIKQRAQGSWLWTRSVMSALRTGKQHPSSTDRVPQTLQLVYKQFLADMASGNNIDDSIAERTLYWIIFAREPLAVCDILVALNLNSNNSQEASHPMVTQESVLKSCKGLVEVTDGRFRLIHRSAEEYFAKVLNASLAHTYIIKVCLAILTTMTPLDPTLDTSTRNLLPEEALYVYAKKHHMMHGFRAVALDQRIGPFIESDDLPSFEQKHTVGGSIP